MNISLNADKFNRNSIDLLAASRDASFYSLQPQVIAKPTDEYDIISLFEYAKHTGHSLTFRAAGTSLSGQSLSDSILVVLAGAWKESEIISTGSKIKAQPGVNGAHLNRKLQRFARVIGPDPASISACMVGGIIANNSSGMRSGILRNAYNSISDIRFILANGVIVDTEKNGANEKLKREAPDIYNGLLDFREEVLANGALVNKISEQYKIKNVVGYSLNSFLDYDNPVDILAHLLIGSEGTLGFISSATFETFANEPVKLTGMLVFQNVVDAAAAIVKVRATGVSALEIVDNHSLKSLKSLPAIKALLGEIDDAMSILLFEFQESARSIIEAKLVDLERVSDDLNLMKKPLLTWDSQKQSELWSIRSGLLPSLGASRTPGTTFILEDISFPLDVIHNAIPALIELFAKYGYTETGIYGHGMDGNLHFMLTQNFDNKNEIARYDAFMNALAELVIERFGGSMKAEHGTGRNIAPFVERQWGNDAYSIMKRIKTLLDPDNILNPGVLLNENPTCHLENIKSYPVLYDESDKCIECGFCEPVCPSADLSQSPRKRIVLMRERDLGNYIQDVNNDCDFEYNVNETCAVDGLCSVACPVGINTGVLVKSNRNFVHGKLSRKLADYFAGNFALLQMVAKSVILLGHSVEYILGTETINKLLNTYKSIFNLNKIEHWNDKLGMPVKIIYKESVKYDFLYFPTCISRMLGKPKNSDAPSLFDVISGICKKARINLKIPENVNDYCCGTVFSSKGFHTAYVKSINKLIEMFWNESAGGILPIIFDSSSCVQTAKSCRNDLSDELKIKYDDLTILDISEFLADYVLPNVQLSNKSERVVLHQTCSTIKLNIENKLEEIASSCAAEVIIPEYQGCCAMAGDRGLLYPELTESATRDEADEIIATEADGYYSSNLPCETAMSSSSAKQYLSIAYLVLKSMD